MVQRLTHGMTTPPLTAFDPQRFREVLGQYPTGVAMVTGIAPDGELLALIVGTFSSVSLDPPLVSFMPMKTSKTFARLRECGSLCINVLSGSQEQLARTISRRYENKFDGIDWVPSPSGDPILADTLSWLDVRVEKIVEAGDHDIVLCRVLAMDAPNPVAPLIFFQGGYGTFVVRSLIARMESDIVPAVQQAADVRAELEALAKRVNCEVGLLYRANPDELVTVASAVGPHVSMGEGLGQRIPVFPPFADVFIAHDGPEAEERWLAPSQAWDAAQTEVYRSRLAFAREHGYVISFLPDGCDDAYVDMAAAVRRYGSAALTPAEDRALRQAVATSEVSYAPEVPETGRRYRIGSLVAPIHGPDGGVAHCLRLSRMPLDTPGETVVGWLEALKASARVIEQRFAEA